jgi:hypothetical protein
VDRGYEGDSGYLAHLESAAGADRWDPGPREPDRWDPGPREHDRWDTAPSVSGGTEPGTDDAAAGVARRLQARLDRHLWLLERLQAEQLYPEPPGLPELQDTARLMRRDTESLLLLSGHEPGVGGSGPRWLGDIVADAADAAEEPRLVDVRAAPDALVAPAAAVEFMHVLAELVDHIIAVYPGAVIELVSRIEPAADPRAGGRGVTVDALVEGPARHDPDGLGGRRAAAVAEQLARCSRHGIALRRQPGGSPPAGSGLVASVHCPPAAVTVEEPEPVAPPEPARPAFLNGSELPLYGGTDHAAWGTKGFGSGIEAGNGAGHPPPSFDESPTYTPSSSSQVDELFGPLIDLPLEPIDDRYATPIFEAIASAWFREDSTGGEPGRSDPLDWETPQDDEWREAAARAARSDPAPTTSTGLPRRRPGNQLVPPPRSTGQNGQNSQNGQNAGIPAERVPDRVRDRLSTYQRGLREGRHRAVGSEGPDPEDW